LGKRESACKYGDGNFLGIAGGSICCAPFLYFKSRLGSIFALQRKFWPQSSPIEVAPGHVEAEMAEFTTANFQKISNIDFARFPAHAQKILFGPIIQLICQLKTSEINQNTRFSFFTFDVIFKHRRVHNGLAG
jgi:hypothetical protein